MDDNKNGVDDEGQHQVLTKVRCCRGKTFSLIPQIPLHLLSRSKVSLFIIIILIIFTINIIVLDIIVVSVITCVAVIIANITNITTLPTLHYF